MTNHGPLTVGYIETKDIGASLDETEKSEQMGRYLRGLNNLVLTDYPLTQKAKGRAYSKSRVRPMAARASAGCAA